MLSVSNVSGGAAASGYYRTEGYYKQGTPEAEAAAQWHGKATEALAEAGQTQFSGAIDDRVFTELLTGQAPSLEKSADGSFKDGPLMGRWVDGERQHRPGLDLTFSASKSVSIMALVVQDERVIAAHDTAVKAAVTFIEDNLAATRRQGSSGEIEVVQGGKLIAGLFRHDTSRALDPQLHTHAVIANMVMGADGKFTALHNDEIYRGKMVGGEVYRNELARNLQEIGYQIERKGKDRLVEIVGVPEKLIETYSKRSQAIATALEERGIAETAETRALAALATRVKKDGNLDRSALHGEWVREAREAGMPLPLLEAVKQQSEVKARWMLPGVTRDGSVPEHLTKEAKAALTFAISHLSERQSVYAERDILKVALPRLQLASVNDLQREINNHLKEGQLLTAGTSGQQRLYTDRETLTTEREALKEYRSAKNATAIELPKYNDGKRSGEGSLKLLLSTSALTEGQQEAILTSLTGSSRFVGVQGLAGTGKTYMIDTMRRYAERAGYELDGLAPSGRAVEALKEAVPNATTLQSWLVQIRAGSTPGAEDKSKRILVVDEAGMLSAADMRDLMKFANGAGYARVVLVGDTKQLDAVGAGQPFAQLQRAGMPTALMADIQRQRHDEGREAVLHSIRGEIRDAMKKIGPVQELSKDGPMLPSAVASRWLDMPLQQRDQTGIVVLTNAVRTAVNSDIREGLKREHQIGAHDIMLSGLSPLGFTRAEAADARSWKSGDILIPTQTHRKEGLERDQIYTVTGTDLPSNTLTLRHPQSGEEISLRLKQGDRISATLRAYEPNERDFATNERVKFSISDKDAAVINGARGRITQIEDGSISVRMDDGRRLALPRDSLAARGMDHAYAATAHDFQGTTVDRIIIGMSATEQMVSQKAFYVNISRMREEAILITTDVEGLTRRIEQNTGERPTALDSWLKAEQEAKSAATSAQSENRARVLEPAKTEGIAERGHLEKAMEKFFDNATIGPDQTLSDFQRSAEKLQDLQKQKTIEGPIR
ncbi:relaxase domain-containing protein (plasmid) [Gemmobacter fulvus]|uniref:Relaxase domain-containing protein n=1 Tax=Gemmobacter fulvus TaxID=2840474 RepID=A0A975S4F6_9RHOB|nr:MobF family relaxase [Gemmobacter fulvus]MBT9247968.1 relaxase domain-containing protein [Gemmobacter fulvus]QWK93023.1 relaxase domain-containing protein [Gemmobacter fulvus]